MRERVKRRKVRIFKEGDEEKMKKLLFVCSEALDRSPAAASLFEKSKKYEAKVVGISPLAETQISKQAIKWANIIFCMEHEHKVELTKKFPEAWDKEIVVLNILNNYVRNDPELAKLLKIKLVDLLE